MVRITIQGLPEVERPHAQALDRNLTELDVVVRRFECALTLFDFCIINVPKLPQQMQPDAQAIFEQFNRVHEWADIACRDAALTLWDFATCLSLIENNLDLCPTVSAMLDRVPLKAEVQRFERAFPGSRLIRNAQSHRIDIHGNVEAEHQNAMRGPTGDERRFESGFDGRMVYVTKNRQKFSYELSAGSAEALRLIAAAVCELFRPVELACYRLRVENMDKPGSDGS